MGTTGRGNRARDAAGASREGLASRLLAWLAVWRRRAPADEEVARELRTHLELEAEEHQAAGMSADEARFAARRALGNYTQTHEATRAVWHRGIVERLTQDLRHGARQLRRSPGFTALAALTLALGIGASTAIFTVVDAVLLRPLPFAQPDRLVRLWEAMPSRDYHRNVVNPANFLEWRDRARSFTDMAAISVMPANVNAFGEPKALPGVQVSPQFFNILGVSPLLGRAFLAEEGTPGHEHVVVLSYGLWQSLFNGDRRIIARQIRINEEPYTIVGIMPRGFGLPNDQADLWVPQVLSRTGEASQGRYLTVIGRRKAGVSLAQAREEMIAIGAQLARERPQFDKNWTVEVIPYLEDVTQEVRPALLLLLAAVGLLLLIACANVANLLLVRSTARWREIAVRSALGAGRARIVAQMLTESLLLALFACAAGLVLAQVALKSLLAALPEGNQLPRMETIHLDPAMVLFAIGLSIGTVVLFGLAPAIQASRLDVQDGLKQGSTRTVTGGNRGLRDTFVVLELAMALLLLAGAGLMVHSFFNLMRVNPGFQPAHVLTMRIFTSPAKYSDDRKRSAYLQRILEEIRAVPGVEAAGSIHFLPLEEQTSGSCFSPANGPHLPPSEAPDAEFLVISPGYFRAMAMPILQGRDFAETDRFGSASVIVVNDGFARKFYPAGDAIGKRLNVCWTLPNPGQIVGIVADARQTELAVAPKPTIFLANAQAPMYFANLVVRARMDAARLPRAVEAAIHRVDAAQPVSSVRTMDEVRSASVAQPRFQLLLLGLFSLIAIALASIGIYGVLSYSVAQRTPEIGVRVALGARGGDVVGLILREGVRLALIGIVCGTAAAALATRLLRSLLFEVQPSDPATLIAVPTAVLLVALVATLLPARRALKLNPVNALRWE